MAPTDPTHAVTPAPAGATPPLPARPAGRSLVVRARDRVAAISRRVQNTGRWLVLGSRNPVVADALPFQDELDEIIEEEPPLMLQATHYLVAVLFISIVVISAIMKVDIVVVGSGRLMTETPTIMLQPIERAIIREINVKTGDVVTKGQVIATLDPTFAQADLASLQAQKRALQAQIRRLEAELNGVPFETGSAATTDDLLQSVLYRQRQSEYGSRLRVFDEDILRIQASLRTLEEDRTFLEQQLEVARDVEAMRASAVKSQAGSRLQFLDSQAARMSAERDFRETANRLAELRHDVMSRQAGRAAFVDEWRRSLLENLVAARGEAAKIAEALTKAERLHDLVVVTAPEDGVVLEVAKRSVGSVMREAELLATIVPSRATLVAEVSIGSSDVGYLKPGDPVVMKVDAFPYQRHGLVPGRLLTVSEESFFSGGGGATGGEDGGLIPPRAGGAYHRARIELLKTQLEAMPEGIRMIPGMTLAAEIKVGTRTVMSFFLDPLTRALGESIREP